MGYISDDFASWEKYQNADEFTDASRSTLRIQSTDNWAIIGIPLTVDRSKKYKISFKYINGTDYNARTGYSGIACQILNSLPTNSDCSTISDNTIQLINSDWGVEHNVEFEFTPSTNLVYLVFNLGYIAPNQEISLDIFDFSINDKPTTDVTSKEIVYGKENSFGIS